MSKINQISKILFAKILGASQGNKKKLFLTAGVLVAAAVVVSLVFYLKKQDTGPRYTLPVNLPAEVRQDYEKRIADNLESLKLFPKNYNVLLDIGNLERELGNASTAIDYFIKAAEAIPANSIPWLNIGNIYVQLGLYRQAENSFLKALDLDRSYVYNYTNLTDLYKNYLKDKSNQIKGLYLEGLKYSNNDPQLLYFYAEYLIEIKNYTEALEYLKVLVGKTPPDQRQQVLDRINQIDSLINQNLTP